MSNGGAVRISDGACRGSGRRIRLLGAVEVDETPTRAIKPIEFVFSLALAGGEMRTQMLKRHLYLEFTSRSALATLAWRARSLGIDTYHDVSRSTYRLLTPVSIDAIELLTFLDMGDLESALSLYHGPCLARSESPVAESTRRHIEERIARAALETPKAHLRSLAGRLLDDPRLIDAQSNSTADMILASSLERAEAAVW